MLTLVTFCFVYLVMMVGRTPGLRLDRAGAALLGAITLVASGVLSSHAAWAAIDVATLGLLLGTMLVSAQFQLAGAYAWLARWLAARRSSPTTLLLQWMLAAGLLSALLTNDVVCLALAPVLVALCSHRRLDPVPFLLGLAAAANLGSAATLIGNPQNMLIGQSLQLSFAAYLWQGAPPALLGLVIAWWILARSYRGRWERVPVVVATAEVTVQRWQAAKGMLVLLALVLALLFSPLPREVLALSAGGLLLLTRRHASRALLQLADWPLLVLFAGLFILNHALAQQGLTASGFAWLRERGLDLADPVTLFATSVVGSNLVSNVPLTMLILPEAKHALAGPILALATTLAGNLLLVGSIANLIVVEQAMRMGIAPVRRSWFGEHFRTGVPITFATLALAALWLWLLR